MKGLSGDLIFCRNIMFFYYCYLKILTLKFCKDNISKSIIARGLKPYHIIFVELLPFFEILDIALL